VTPNANVQYAQLQTGELDYAGVRADALADLLSQPNLGVKSALPPNCDAIGYNLDRPWFQDKPVRQALTLGLDRNQILKQYLLDYGAVVDTPVPTISWAYESDVRGFKYDPGAAKQLLAGAGWMPGPDGTLQKNGAPFKYSLIASSGNNMATAVSTIAQSQYRTLGIELNPEILESGAYQQRLVAHDFDAAMIQIQSDVDPDPSLYFLSSEYPNGQNYVKYSNAEVDQLLRQAASLPGCGQDSRKDLYNRFQQIVAEDQPYTYLYSRAQVFVYNKRIQGFDPSGMAASEWNMHTWSLSG
jgi:peptide/nickel transport system substrate-binding protein